jgi:hypothetical protein
MTTSVDGRKIDGPNTRRARATARKGDARAMTGARGGRYNLTEAFFQKMERNCGTVTEHASQYMDNRLTADRRPPASVTIFDCHTLKPFQPVWNLAWRISFDLWFFRSRVVGEHQDLWGLCCRGLSGLCRIVVDETGIPFLEQRPKRAIERAGSGLE